VINPGILDTQKSKQPKSIKLKKLNLILIFLLIVFSLPAEVKNEDKPLKGEWYLKTEKIWEISRYGKKSMAIPNVGSVLDDGTVCIFDYKYKLNYIFDKNSRYIDSFGKKGEGPGEVRSQLGFFAVKDMFVVVDHFRLHYFDKNCSYLRTVPFTRGFGYPKVFVNENEYISLASITERFEFNRVNLIKKSFSTLKGISDYRKVSMSTGKRLITVVIPPLTPRIFCDFDQQRQSFVYGKNNEYKIWILDLNQGNSECFSLNRKKRPLTKSMKKKINREMHLSKKMWDRFPRELTHFNKIQIKDGFIYIFVSYFEEIFDKQKLDIFSLDGKYLYRAFFKPDAEEEIYSTSIYHLVLKDNHFYASIQTRNGDMKVVKYRVSLPKMGE